MGSGGKSKQQPMPAINAPSFNTDPSAYQNIGYQQTPNPYTSQGKPAWMQGYFDDPSWGRAAADPTVQLTHEMLGPNGAGALNQAVYGNAPEALRGNLQAGPQQGGSLAQAGGGMPAGAVPPSMNPKSSIGMGLAGEMANGLRSDMERYPYSAPYSMTSGYTPIQGG